MDDSSASSIVGDRVDELNIEGGGGPGPIIEANYTVVERPSGGAARPTVERLPNSPEQNEQNEQRLTDIREDLSQINASQIGSGLNTADRFPGLEAFLAKTPDHVEKGVNALGIVGRVIRRTFGAVGRLFRRG